MNILINVLFLFHFRYRYTLQELPSMLLRLKRRADSFDNWATEVKRSLDPSDPKVGELLKFFFFINAYRLRWKENVCQFDARLLTLHLETNSTGMGHFQVSKTLVRLQPSVKPLFWKQCFTFICMRIKVYFQIKGFATNPWFKRRLGTTWKCCLYLTNILVVVFEWQMSQSWRI